MIAVVARPSAVHPRAHDQSVEDSRIIFVDGVEGGEGALQVFGIEPPSYGEHGTVDVLHVRRKVAGLPIIVVGVVADLVVIQRAFAFQIF